MNEIKRPDTEVTLSDLRLLGKQGNATARLDDGSILQLRPKEAVKPATGIINGEKVSVLVACDYAKIYSQIRTIKRGDVLIARRSKFGNEMILKLTGQGFVRPNRKLSKKYSKMD